MKLKIREFREELQLTQKELAEKINNVQRNISNWENGSTEPDLATIEKLAEIFDVSIDALFRKEPFNYNANFSNLDYLILQQVKILSEPQKYALLQLLKEMSENKNA